MSITTDIRTFLRALKSQDLAFYFAAAYLMFEYLRPHVIYRQIDFLPWARLTILFGLTCVIFSKRLRIQASHWLLFLFIVAVYISSLLSYNSTASFNQIGTAISWLVVVIFFTNSVKNVEQYKLLTILLFLFLFKLSLFGARTWAMRGFSFTNWGISGPAGFFQNSGELSLLMVVFSVMSFAFIAAHKNANKLYYLVPLTAAMTVLAASSRGGQLAFAVVAVLLAISLGKIRIRNILFLCLVACAGFMLLPQEQKDRFSTMGTDGTSESRLVYWEKGWEMLNENKLFGVGHNAFAHYFEDNYAPFIDFEKFTYRREVAHNSFIQVGSEMGYTGLLLYLALIGLCFRLTKKTRRLFSEVHLDSTLSWIPKYCTGMNIAMIGYLIGSAFMSVAFYPYLYLILMLNQALYNTTKEEVDKVEASSANSSINGAQKLAMTTHY